MLFSYQWLKQYVPEIPTPAVLKEELTRRSVEVESIEHPYPLLRDIVVAEILSVEKHPNADKLTVCMLSTGAEPIQVVCGGSNVKAGMHVAFAPIGATVQWHGEGEPIVLEKAKLRGLESFGMICSSSEIGLSSVFPPFEREVFDATHLKAAPGTKLSEALNLNDVIIDIDNKSMTHRPDLFSHQGMAREIAAVFNLELTLPQYAELPVSLPTLQADIHEGALCRRYRSIEMDVTVGPSPDWMRQRLELCGIKSINNVVDITNIILLDYGQPSHAFDADKVNGHLIVRRAQKGESVETLDHKTHVLDESILVIADTTHALDIAGIIGGMDSAVSEHTTRIILEVAHFDAVAIRKASQKVGVRTDGALRWEKGPSEDMPTYSVPAAIELFQKYANATVRAAVDVYPKPRLAKPVTVSKQFVERLVGLVIPQDQVQASLERLGCVVEVSAETYTVTPPWFRTDLRIEEDVIEELVRMYGIHRIPEKKLRAELFVGHIDPEVSTVRSVRDSLQGIGYQEVYNYSFYGEELMKKYGMQAEDHVEILNPLSDDLRYLRTSVLPRVFETAARNRDRLEGNAQFFEIGHVYFADREVRQLAVVVVGDDAMRRLRGGIEYLLQSAHIPSTSEVITQTNQCQYWSWYDQHQALAFRSGDRTLGTLGLLSSELAKHLSFSAPVAFASFSIPELVHDAALTQPIMIPSQYPSIPLDISLIVPQEVLWQDIAKLVRTGSDETIQSIEVLDVYQGASLPVGKKSVAFRVVFQASDRTLQMKDIEAWRDGCVARAQKQFGAILRDNS